MDRHRRLSAASIAAVAAFVVVAGSGAYFAAGQPAAGTPDALFVLGDSLSDIGNAAVLSDYLLDEPFQPEHTIGFCNPGEIYLRDRDCADLFFRRSRVSDGPVAVEYLADALGLPELTASFHTLPERPEAGTNYAVAGAKARGTGPADLQAQLLALQLDHGPRLPESALYFVMIGGNDAIDALKASALPTLSTADDALSDDVPSAPVGAVTEAARIIDDAIAALDENLVRLIGFGARDIVVANVPDLALLPAVRDTARRRAIADEVALDAARSVTTTYNARLDEMLARLERDHPEASIRRFDIAAVLEAQRSEAETAGWNTLDACFDSERYLASLVAAREFHPDCAPQDGGPPRFGMFLFWDGIHPTGAVHAVIGEALAETVLGEAILAETVVGEAVTGREPHDVPQNLARPARWSGR